MTEEEKRQRLISLGFDPNIFEYEDENVTNTPTVKPLANSLNTSSATGSFLRSAARGALPSLAAGAATFGVGSLLDVTGVGAPIGIPLQLAGAGIAGFGARKLQDIVAPSIIPGYAESEQQDIEQHPIASGAGNILSTLAGGLSPNLSNIPRAAKTIRALTTGVKSAQSEVQNLLNVGLGATIPPAQQTAVSLAQGQGIPNLQDLLLSSAGGALFSQPNIIGRRLFGWQPNLPSSQQFSAEEAAKTQLRGRGTPLGVLAKPEDIEQKAQDIRKLHQTVFQDILPKLKDDIESVTELASETGKFPGKKPGPAQVIPGFEGFETQFAQAMEKRAAERKLAQKIAKAEAKSQLEAERIAKEVKLPTKEVPPKLGEFPATKVPQPIPAPIIPTTEAPLTLPKGEEFEPQTIVPASKIPIAKAEITAPEELLKLQQAGKPITANQLRIMKESLQRSLTEGQIPLKAEEPEIPRERIINPEAGEHVQEGDIIKNGPYEFKILRFSRGAEPQYDIQDELRRQGFTPKIGFGADVEIIKSPNPADIGRRTATYYDENKKDFVKIIRRTQSLQQPSPEIPPEPEKPSDVEIAASQFAINNYANILGKHFYPNESQQNQIKAGIQIIDNIVRNTDLGQSLLDDLVLKGVMDIRNVEGFRRALKGHVNNFMDFQGKGRPYRQPAPEITKEVQLRGYSINPTVGWHNIFQKLGLVRGAKVTTQGLILDPITGKSISGEAYVRTGINQALAKINTSKAGLDTWPHELFHIFYHDLLASDKVQDNKVAQAGDLAARSSKEYLAQKATDPSLTPHEFLTRKVGADVVRRVFKTDGNGRLANWFRDFWSYIKTRWAPNRATSEDYTRLFSNRLLYDRPFKETTVDTNKQIIGERFQRGALRSYEPELSREEKDSKLRNLAQMQHRVEDIIQGKLDAIKFDDRIIAMAHNIVLKEGGTPTEENVRQTADEISYAIHNITRPYDVENAELNINLGGTPVSEGAQRLFGQFNTPENTQELNSLANSYRKIQHESKEGRQWNKLNDEIIKTLTPKRSRFPLQQEEPEIPSEMKEPEGFPKPKEFEKLTPTENLLYDLVNERNGIEARMESHMRVQSQAYADFKTGKITREEFDAIRIPNENSLNKYLKIGDQINRQINQLRPDINKSLQQESPEISPLRPLTQQDSENVSSAQESNILPNTIPEQRIEREWHLGKLRPEIEKIKTQGESGRIVGDSMDKFYENYRENIGKYIISPIRELKDVLGINAKSSLQSYLTQDSTSAQHVRDYLWDIEDKGKSNIQLTPQEQEGVNIIQAYLKSVRDEQNSRPALRKGGYNPDYIPFIADRDVINSVINKPNSEKAQSLIKEFIDYQISKGKTKQEALDQLKTFRAGYAKEQPNIAKQFGPIDKAAGVGIPRSWREKNLVDTLARYGNRVARRFAYHDNMEANPAFEDALINPNTGVAGNESVKAVMRDIAGIRPTAELARTAALGLIKAGIFGPLTGVRNFAQNFTLGLEHSGSPALATRAFIDSWQNMKQNLAESFASGVNRENISSIEFGDEGRTNVISLLRRVRDIASDIQGRNILERITRATTYGQGKFLAMHYLEEANQRGNFSKDGAQFFKNFGQGIDITPSKESFTPAELSKIASRLTENIQGKYDYRGLPQIAVEGTLAPFLALSRWSIERSNNFMKYVVSPALNGNYKPFLLSTLGMVLGGEVVNAITQFATGKKEKTASFKELAEASKEGKNIAIDALYKMAALSSVSGYAGILGDLAKAAADKIYGKVKPQSYNNALVEFASNTAETGADFIDALREGELDTNSMIELVNKLLSDHIQTYRVLLAHLGPETKENIDRINKLRDLRTFNTLGGDRITDLSEIAQANPLRNIEVKRFKKEQDIGKAVEMLPSLIQNAIERSKGNPEKLREELRSLKENQYPTLPNPKTLPFSFLNYIKFLQNTQGNEEASQRLTDYLMRNTINKEKSQLVPSI